MKNWYTFLLAAALATLPMAVAQAAEGPPAAHPAKEFKAAGFETPKKGPLVSELREAVGDENPNLATVVRIYEDMGGNRVKESSINGAVFQIEVFPFRGVSYILRDTEGDGIFRNRFNGHDQFVVPQWVLFRF